MAIREDSKYICIRECFIFNKHFIPGEGFPNHWLDMGYEPNKHFAPAHEAHAALEAAKKEKILYGHGDDKRSTRELKKALSAFMKFPENWTRKKIWLELRRHEAAKQRDQKPKKV